VLPVKSAAKVRIIFNLANISSLFLIVFSHCRNFADDNQIVRTDINKA